MSLLPNLDIQRTIEQKTKEVLQNPVEQVNDLINGRTERKEPTQSTESTRSLEGATKIPYGGAAELGGHKFTVQNGRPFMNNVDMNGGPFGPNEVREVSKDGYVAFAKDRDWYVVQEGKTPAQVPQAAQPSTGATREPEYRIRFGESLQIGSMTYHATPQYLESDKGSIKFGDGSRTNLAGTPDMYQVRKEKDGWALIKIDGNAEKIAQQIESQFQGFQTPGSSVATSPAEKLEVGRGEYRIPFGQSLQLSGTVFQSTNGALVVNGTNTSNSTFSFAGTGYSYRTVKENDGWALIRMDASKTTPPAASQELKPQGHITPVEPPMGQKPVGTTPPEAPRPKKDEGHKLEEGKPYTLNGLTYELKGGQLLIAGQATQLKDATNEVVIPGDKQKGTPDRLAAYVVKGTDGSITIYDPAKVAAKPAPSNEPSAAKPDQSQPITRTTGIPWEEYFKGEATAGKGPVHEMMKYAEANPEKFMAALAETQQQSGSLNPRLQLLLTYTRLTIWSKLDTK